MLQSIPAKQAIMVYEEEEKTFCVHYTKKDDVWDDPKPLSTAELKALVTEPSEPHPLPPQMLWYEEDKLMIWYTRPRREKITVSGKGGEDKESYYVHPGLVFKVKKGVGGGDLLSIAVWSIKSPKADCIKRPEAWDTLYRIPYAAIDVHPSDGSMGNCNVTTPTDTAYCLDAIYDWQNSFYFSKFNYRPDRADRLKQKEQTLLDWMKCTK